jgi:hypothetical protein
MTISLSSTLNKVLSFVAGILIPGSSESTTDLTHAIQQELATAFGQAAKDLAEKLALDTTGMSGPDKVFAIVKALVATGEAQGIKADIDSIGAVALDVAQAAYRTTLLNLGSGLIALASLIESAGGIKLVTALVIRRHQVARRPEDRTRVAKAAKVISAGRLTIPIFGRDAASICARPRVQSGSAVALAVPYTALPGRFKTTS